MNLLFDANLSPSLVLRLADFYPGSLHVFDVGDLASDDLAIWNFAAAGGFVIATKDVDFLELSLLRGAPPKVVLLRVGNVTTDAVENLLRANKSAIDRFAGDPHEAVLLVEK